MIFQTWKISTLNSMTFQTFPGSVRTLVKLKKLLTSTWLNFLDRRDVRQAIDD